jgi:hypothetical protein
LADTKARRVVFDAERDAIERELERTRSRDEMLRRLDAEEAEMRQRIESGYDNLDDATPEKRRQVYEDLQLRVEVGADAEPHIGGIFPMGRYGDTEDHLYINGKSGYVLSSQISGKEALSGSGRTS